MDDGAAAYAAWQAKIGQLLAKQPGFLGQQVIAPTPPTQVDWIVIQRFSSLKDAQDWMQSDALHESLSDIKGIFVGQDSIYLRNEAPAAAEPATVLISCDIAPEDEVGFQEWEMEAFRVESAAPGFLGHRLQRPVPGIQDKWIIELTFDNDANLERWLNSPERTALLKSGTNHQGGVQIRKGSYGFEFWSREKPSAEKQSTISIVKGNMLVLLVLYPTVYLWGYLFSTPFIDKPGAPVWVSLFLGNLFSTQIMGFYFVPWAFKQFDFWMNPKPGTSDDTKGWVIVLALYALSMALFAYILTLPKLSFF